MSTSRRASATATDRCGTKSGRCGTLVIGDQSQHRVHEGGHEHAQRDLVADVADEVAHHPGTELLRCQRQGEDGDGEYNADHGDHRRRDGYEHLAGGVCAPRLDPERQVQMLVVRGPVDLEGNQEKEAGDHDQDGRHEPEGCPEGFPPPTGQLALAVTTPGCRACFARLLTVCHNDVPTGRRATTPQPCRTKTS